MTSPTSATSSISGLVSGMDTASIISQLMQIEAQPQQLLKTQLSSVAADAAAYRDVNTSFAGLAGAASALTQAATWAPAKATSSDSSVTATASTGAQPGTFSFHVDQLATAQTSTASQTWTNLTDAYGLGSTLTIKDGTGTNTLGTIAITSSTTGPASLSDAVTAINNSGLGLAATPIKTSSGYVLQVTATSTGTAKAFTITSDTDPSGADFTATTAATDAQISFSAGGTSYTNTSGTNTFDGVLPGLSFTVSQQGTNATIKVATDPDAIANAVQSMVTAANAALSKIYQYTDSSTGSTAPLKGDWSLISLAGQIIDNVSSAVGVSSGTITSSSAGSNGLQITIDPTTQRATLSFDSAAFKTALAANPKLVQQVFSGATDVGADNVPNTADDVKVTDGVGARLALVALQASDKTTGLLTSLANGEDTRATDIQSQIDSWTLRLQLRQQTLTNQFNAMETALGTLKSQSSWLTSQINALPSWSSSSSKSN